MNGDGTESIDMQVTTLPQVVLKQNPTSTELEEERLSPEWNYLRNPETKNYKLGDGKLTLTASTETIDGLGNPTFIGRRQQHKCFTAETELTLNGKKAGDEAGLSVFMKNMTHYDISLYRKKDGHTYVRLRYRLGKLTHTEKEIALGEGVSKASLRIEGEPDTYRFSYSTDGKNYTEIGEMDTRFISSESGGGFTGAYLALYAQKTDKTSKATAAYERFCYVGKEE